MVGDKYALDRHILQICGQLGNIVMEAGRFDNNSLAVFFNDEDLIVNKIVGFICVQLHRAEIVNADLALCEFYLVECVLVHDMISRFIFDFCFGADPFPCLQEQYTTGFRACKVRTFLCLGNKKVTLD